MNKYMFQALKKPFHKFPTNKVLRPPLYALNVYTDASVKDNTIGIGVFFELNNDYVTTKANFNKELVDSLKICSTVGELSAILYVLNHVSKHIPLIISTDSLVSINLILRKNTNPKFDPIVNKITQLLDQRYEHTWLNKVEKTDYQTGYQIAHKLSQYGRNIDKMDKELIIDTLNLYSKNKKEKHDITFYAKMGNLNQNLLKVIT